MKFRSALKYILPVLSILLVCYLFRGPLFPWNPIKSGYKKIKSSRATLYITEPEGEESVYKLDEIIADEESFHDLKFQKNIRIIVLGKESSMKRYLPWIRGSGYSVKLGSVNVIYIGARARRSPYGVGVYLKHEISHLLIHQNVSSGSKNMEILKQGWLAEGLATYFGGPRYFEKNEFLELWGRKGLSFDSLYEENPHDMGRDIIQLKYTYYRFFVEFLVESYGLEKLQDYLKEYMISPESYRAIFPEVYGLELSEILGRFDTYMTLSG
jgi:hypothetical protein